MVKLAKKYDELFIAIDKLKRGECLRITLDESPKFFYLALSYYCIKHNKKIEFDLRPLRDKREWMIIK